MHVATLDQPDDFAAWRDQARMFLAAAVPPHDVAWRIGESGTAELFANAAPPPAQRSAPLHVPRALLALLRLALLHRDPDRFALAYRLLWRLRDQPSLHANPADPDMIAVQALAKAVRRDMHKMHAFVRFRKVGSANGREQFAAWFEPDHHITRAVAGFFRDRFTGMDWIIVTPEATIGWDGTILTTGPGGRRGDVPDADAVEDEWRAYYSSIFNPARVKVAAMKKEMPVKYWRNLPEAMLVQPLLRQAEGRVDAMVKRQREDAAILTAEPVQPRRHFDTLDALNAALVQDDVPPSPDFADRVVLGEGPPSARLMLVGEQPGDMEDRKGRPFVGPAGQLLDDCLDDAGIERSETYLTNAVKRFKFTERGKRRLHQTPNAGDIAHYRWWLNEEIRLVDPAVVVALGATALHALTGKKQALAPLRDGALDLGERQMIVTVHPSFLLRLPDEQARGIERERFVRDLAAARALV
ncbi:UdgX family uracil-DNA binding protein [Sphingomonas suaedae]|uniref:Type-4 uracil-DNA glycosylase n=1 Tax=Sphingomonas suaedae TaxID=2599297 RepID=A0A518RDB8_9SPHN|nr:UdgX family uracil-DNA binding protein [Sphingomonas suaedae]QDX25394.1 UdgX family uracil-DNA binding protein [Sphingomonas suaedae]